jgi:hypothetical protein
MGQKVGGSLNRHMTSNRLDANLLGLDGFSFYEFEMCKRSRSWEWSVGSRGGKAIMRGRARKRVVARYQATSALFLLLMNVSTAAPSRN